MARQPALPPVRVVSWWIRHVVVPLVTCRAWWRRAAAIFTNNMVILSAVMAVGHWPVAPLFAVAGLGVSLGVALHVMAELPVLPLTRWPCRGSAAQHRIRVGVALNLLEPPAIMLTVGLSLARPVMPFPATQSWETFGLWVAPATLLAAAGEALWLGAALGQSVTPEDSASGSADGDCDPR